MLTKVLIIRFRRIGDSVLSSVICSTLRKNFPEAEIHYVLCEPIGTLYEGHPDIDRVISFSQEEYARVRLFWKKVYRLMRDEKYEVIIDTRSTLKTLCFSLFSLGTKFRIGKWKWYSFFLHNYRIKNQRNEVLDEVERNLLLVKPLEVLKPIKYVSDFRLYFSSEEVERFQETMEKQGIDFSRPLMVCTPFTRVVGKEWNMERMKELLSRILVSYPVQMIFNYDKNEKESALALFREMGSPSRILIHVEADSLRKLGVMLSLSNFFFGNEGGPRHMAQAVGIPAFAIYPPGVSKRKWLPNPSKRNQGISLYDLVPNGELKRMTEKERFDNVSVETVWERLTPMLDDLMKCGN